MHISVFSTYQLSVFVTKLCIQIKYVYPVFALPNFFGSYPYFCARAPKNYGENCTIAVFCLQILYFYTKLHQM